MPRQPFGFALNGDTPGFWEDMRFPATRSKLGANSKPDFDYTNFGLLFPQNDTDEYIAMSDQMPHAWAGGTSIHPHVHYIQDEAGEPIWKLAYRFYNNGDAVPSFTTISTDDGDGNVFAYTSGTIMQICRFPDIALPSLSTSGWCDFKFWREDNVVAGDVLFKGFDFHLLLDSWGSYEEYTKT